MGLFGKKKPPAKAQPAIGDGVLTGRVVGKPGPPPHIAESIRMDEDDCKCLRRRNAGGVVLCADCGEVFEVF